MPAHSDRGWLTICLLLALVLATSLAYSRLPASGFVDLDDPDYITANPHVQHGLSLSGIAWAFTHFHSSNWHPLTWLSHMLDVSLFGDWAGGHHLMGLFFHILATLLLFGFLNSMTRRLWPSVLVAALFALHPAHVESVAWASERKDVLSACFWFATLWSYVAYVRRPYGQRYAAVVLLFAMGLMSKPMVVTLPAILLLLDYWPLQRNDSFKALLLEKAPLAILSAASACVTLFAQKTAMTSYDTVGPLSRIANALMSYWRYISQLFWPANQAVLYPYDARPQLLAASLVLVAMVALTVVLLRANSRKYLLAGWLWYVITLVPVLGIIQVGIQAHADRYTYIPYTGLFIMLAWALSELAAGYRLMHYAVVIAMAGALGMLGFVTWQTTSYWKDGQTLFRRAVDVTPDNYVMMTDLGVCLIGREKPDEGLVWLEKARAVKPGYPYVLDGIGMAMYRKGRYLDAAAWAAQALAAKPDMEQAHFNMGMALTQLGQLEEADAHFEKALDIRPDWPQAMSCLGQNLANLGHTQEGKALLDRALSLAPDLPDAHFGLGAIYAGKGDMSAAAAEFRQAARSNADFRTLKNLAGCLMAMGDLTGAETAIRQALQLAPDSAEGHMDLAMVLNATSRHPEAIQEAELALKLDPSDMRLRAKYNALKEAVQ